MNPNSNGSVTPQMTMMMQRKVQSLRIMITPKWQESCLKVSVAKRI